MCRSLHYHLSNIARIRPYINKEPCGHAVRTLISTRLDYANSLLFGIRAVDIQRLQRVQNRAAKLVSQVGKYEHVTPLLNELHWLPIGRRITFKILMLVYKIIVSIATHLLICVILLPIAIPDQVFAQALMHPYFISHAQIPHPVIMPSWYLPPNFGMHYPSPSVKLHL